MNMATQEWRSYIDPLATIADRLLPRMPNGDDPQLRRELYRGIFSQLSSAYNFAGMNPDDDYYLMPIADDGVAARSRRAGKSAAAGPSTDDGVYRISGFRGSVKRIDFQTGTGSFFPRGVMDENRLGVTLANYDLDSIAHAADGAFEVILSPQKPDGHGGHWWKLHPDATYILVRQICYDWLGEIPGRLAIERLDRAAIRPRPSAGTLEENLLQIAKWTETTVQLSLAFAAGIKRDQGVNQMAYKDLSGYGEILFQKYAYGGFDLAPDEALIVEAEVPSKCRYWSIHLMDDLGFTMEWIHRQTLLNGHTAVVDEDGSCRIVISAQDPGVPNWLDTAGYRSGTIQARWEECSHWPEHRLSKVKTAEVRKFLPANTPLVTAEARDASIRLRRKGAQMRKRW